MQRSRRSRQNDTKRRCPPRELTRTGGAVTARRRPGNRTWNLLVKSHAGSVRERRSATSDDTERLRLGYGASDRNITASAPPPRAPSILDSRPPLGVVLTATSD